MFFFIWKASAVFSCRSCTSPFQCCKKWWCSSFCKRGPGGLDVSDQTQSFLSLWVWKILNTCSILIHDSSATSYPNRKIKIKISKWRFFPLCFYNWLQYWNIQLQTHMRTTISQICFMFQNMAAFSFEQSYSTSCFYFAVFVLLVLALWSSLPKGCRQEGKRGERRAGVSTELWTAAELWA